MLYEEHLKEEMSGTSGMQQRHKGLGLKVHLRLGSKRSFNKTARQTFGLGVVKLVVGISVRLQEVTDWTVWMGRPPPK
jgi:hypothetical protein